MYVASLPHATHVSDGTPFHFEILKDEPEGEDKSFGDDEDEIWTRQKT